MRLRLIPFALLIPALACAGQTRRALLIGINLYEPAGTTAQHPAGCAYGRCELGSFDNLDGAVNDAQSMADLLASPKFGFPAENVVLLTNPAPPQPRPGVVTLPPAQTDRDGILAAMQKYLVDLPQKGDTVVFYDASHGSLRVNTKGTKMTVLLDGKLVHADSTLVPADAYKGGFDVRDREMTRIFNAALDKGVHLTVIFDSCHSGGATRGASAYRPRTLPYDPRDVAEAPETLPDGRLRPAPTERTDNPALVFSAAQQDQEANEADPTPAMPESHGAFTAALIEALQVLPADAPASVVYQRVKAVLEGGNAASQNPDLDATAARRQQPLFGGNSANDPGKVRAAALKSESDGTVWLDIGRVSGIGIGSEFTSMKKAGEASITLGVTDLKGIARATAKIISPANAKVQTGEVFELAKWVPADSPQLRFWSSPALAEADILDAAAQIKLAGVASAADPAEEQWTDLLSWDGAHWTLQHANAPAVMLGAKLTANDLKQHLAAGAKLWANLPPSKELAAQITLHDSNSAVQAASGRADANYLLAGTLTAVGPAYAWLHRQEVDAGPPAKATPNHSPGCSATSPYPVRSDWVPLADAKAADDGAASLNKYAALLAKVHGWLQLAESPTGTSTAAYYKLAMVHAADQTPFSIEQTAQQDDRLQLALQANSQITERRWVYVLDIDCHGKGVLLYPRNYAENQFPSDADTGREFPLPGAPVLRIGQPYGVDTLVMLSTAQPLPDPFALEFEGVATRGSGDDSPLGRLLNDTSRGTRGAPAEVPTNWGLDLLTLRSIPKDAAK